MDEETLKRLSDDIEDLKRAVKQNDPMLREVVAPPGWMAFSLLAGLNVTLFALPAHVLVTKYGSFGAIPKAAQIALFAVLALFVVIGGTFKVVIMMRRAVELDNTAGFLTVFEVFYGGKAAHETIPLTLGMIAGTGYAFYAGHPWLSLPLSAFLFGILANTLATRSGVRSYYIVGYWGILFGLVSIPFVEAAPFLWLFVVYGGMLFAFAAAQAQGERSARRFSHAAGARIAGDEQAPGR